MADASPSLGSTAPRPQIGYRFTFYAGHGVFVRAYDNQQCTIVGPPLDSHFAHRVRFDDGIEIDAKNTELHEMGKIIRICPVSGPDNG